MILRELIEIDSTSARSNLPVIELLEAQARRLGFETRRMEWKDDAGIAKANLLARRGPAGEGGLALLGHTDCVPFDPAWEGALRGEEHDGRILGRGAADTKGFLAAALGAAERTRQLPLKKPLWLVFTADEEVGCLGAKRLSAAALAPPVQADVASSIPAAASFPYASTLFPADAASFTVDSALFPAAPFADEPFRPAFAIVGEPTRLIPVLGHKGYCLAEIVVFGAEGHSAYPETGTSAILAAGRVLRELERIGEELQRDSDPLFSPPYTTLNVGLIEGGKAKNVIAGECRLTLEWRPLPGQDPALVPGYLTEACTRLATGGIRIEVRPLRRDRGIAVPRDGALVQFLEAESGNPAETIPFGTELPYLASMGIEACVFGPGDIRVAHRTGEFLELAALARAEEILAHAIERFCG